VTGQIEGGIAQGVGLAVMEEIVVDGGLVRNPSFTDYLIPTVADMPEIVHAQLDLPDLLKLLFEPVPTDRRGEVPEGQKPYFLIPPFNWHKGFLTALYQRQYIDSAQRFADAPRLTPAHVEALDMFDSLANDPKLNLFMEFKPGDVQLAYQSGVGNGGGGAFGGGAPEGGGLAPGRRARWF